jgi:parvulin-like peptidyl-prolyl isomerase
MPFRRPPRSRAALPIGVIILASLLPAALPPVAALAETPSLSTRAEPAGDDPEMGVAAEVGTGAVRVREVLLLWEPLRRKVAGALRAGTLRPDEADEELQAGWESALETLIREEVFVQEAERMSEQLVRKRAEEIYEAQDRRRGGGMSKSEITRELRQKWERDVERLLERRLNRLIRNSGGAGELEKAITAQGMTWSAWRAEQRRRALAELFLNEYVRPFIPRDPRPADIRDYYREHRESFVRPGEVTFRHILFSFEARGGEDAARTAAISVYDAIAAGRLSFEEAARKHSDDPVSRAAGGLETGLAVSPERERWLQEVRDAVREETPGSIGTVLVSETGYHLVQLLDREPDLPMPFREAQKEIVRRLRSEAFERETDKLYRRLRDEVGVRIRMPRYPAERVDLP